MDAAKLFRAAQRKWVREKGFRDPYIAIVLAALEGRGVKLTASDCHFMGLHDDAVATVANNHVEEIVPEKWCEE